MQYLVTLISICFLRAGPQDVPASRTLLVLTGALYFLSGTGASVGVAGFARALLLSGFDILLLVAIVHTGLMLRSHVERMAQTLSAAFGAGILIGMLIWGAVTWLAWLGVAIWPVLFLLVWYIAVFAHILRHAFELPMGVTVAVAIFYAYLSIAAQGLIIPETTTGGA